MVKPVINIHDQATLKHPPLSLSCLFPLAARRAQLFQIPELQQSGPVGLAAWIHIPGKYCWLRALQRGDATQTRRRMGYCYTRDLEPSSLYAWMALDLADVSTVYKPQAQGLGAHVRGYN
jgi:hypothetical protein